MPFDRADYARALTEYASHMRIAGLDLTTEPLPLKQTSVEPLLVAPKDEDPERGSEGSGERIGQSSRASRREPASTALADNRLCVILGDPGQGKSTLLRQQAIALLDLPEIPLLVEMGRIRGRLVKHADRKDGRIFERLPNKLKIILEADWREVAAALEGLLRAGDLNALSAAEPELREHGLPELRDGLLEKTVGGSTEIRSAAI